MGAGGEGRFWKVIGGADKGGILVRTGKQTSSPEASDRLSTGALVKELDTADGRLCYQLVDGKGPETGWVTIKLKDKTLLEEVAGPARKPRVLCLHGTASSPGVLKKQLKTLLELAGEKIDFFFHAGHLACEEDDPIVGSQVKLMKPFFPGETFCQYAQPNRGVQGQPGDGEPAKPETWRSYEALEDAMARAQEALKQHAPIDAVLGFSQGSNLASLLVAQAANGQGAGIRCVVHLCTSLPGWTTDLPKLFPAKIGIPALVIKAEKDMVVSGFDEIVKLYDPSVVQTGQHSGDHRPLPADPKESTKVSEDILNFLTSHCKLDQYFDFCWGPWTRHLAADRCKAEWAKDRTPWQFIPQLEGYAIFEGDSKLYKEELPGMRYGFEFPFTPEMLDSKKYGPQWLTKAFHAAGTLAPDNAVKRISNFKPISGGGASQKASFEVEYEKNTPGLHRKLFMKYPYDIDKDKKLASDRKQISINQQTGDLAEIDAYCLMEASLPFPMPKYYFGDINNKTTNCILITELIPYGDRKRPIEEFRPFEAEPAYRKFFDNEQFAEPLEYYRVMLKENATMAGWYKSGRLGDQELLAKCFPDETKNFFPGLSDSEFKTKLKMSEDFICSMEHFFPPGTITPARLQEWRRVMNISNAYKAEISYMTMIDEDYNAIAHGNMNVDNTWWWRDAGKNLHMGALDWGGLGKISLPIKMWWALYACEHDFLRDNLDDLLHLFVDTYHSEGGPKVDVQVLRRGFMFAALDQAVGLMGAVPFIYKLIPKKAWQAGEVKDRDHSTLREHFLTRMYVMGFVLTFRMIITFDLGKMCDDFLKLERVPKKELPKV